MAPVRKKKAKPARKRAAKRRKAQAQQPDRSWQISNWQIGAAALALAVMLGAALYAVSLSDGPRTTVAALVEQYEVPSLSEPNESAPAQQ